MHRAMRAAAWAAGKTGTFGARALAVGLTVAACVAGPAVAQSPAGGVILTVDGRPVYAWQLELAKREMLMQRQGPVADTQAFMRSAVDRVIGATLLSEIARDAGFKVTDAEVQASLAKQREAVAGTTDYKSARDRAGITEDQFATFERDRLEAQRYIEAKIVPTVTVGDAEVQAYYAAHTAEFRHSDMVHLWMIVVVVPRGASPEVTAKAQARAEKALARLKAGEEFSSVAAEMSDDPSKKEGGLLGWVQRGMLLPELDPAAFSLRPGDMSGVIKSLIGFHVMKVDGYRGPGVFELKDVQDAIARMLRNRKIDEAVGTLVRERRSKATVVALDPTVKDVLAAATAPKTP